MRDDQRSRVYSAESMVRRQLDFAAAGARTIHVAGSVLTVPAEQVFRDLPAVRRYASWLTATAQVTQRWPEAAGVGFRPRRGAQRAHYDRAAHVIALPPAERGGSWALRELVILHELAHALTAGADPPHGPAFTAAFVDLVEIAAGPEVAFLLRHAFDYLGVSVASPATASPATAAPATAAPATAAPAGAQR
ncbi:MAG: TIGR04338 family metallohydrolase [Frankiaceae bacterium]